MKPGRFSVYVIPALIIAIPALVGLRPEMLGPVSHLSANEALHSTIEAVGAVAAVIMALFLIQRVHEEGGGGMFQVALGFLSMGLMDGFHACVQPGHGFVFLRSVAGISGGFWFFMVYFPALGRDEALRRRLTWAVVALSVLLGLWATLFDSSLPAMVLEGGFTPFAKYVNAVAGLLFLAAAVKLLSYHKRSGDMEPFTVSCLALLFGMSNLTFVHSALWDNVWWFWHMLRSAAYVVALLWVIRRHHHTLHNLRTTLEERRLAEQALRESEGRARAITEAATDAIILIDGGGRVIYWNPAAERIFGYGSEEALGRDVHEMLSPQYMLQEAKERFGEFSQTGEGPALGVTRVLSAVRKDGSEFPIELSLSAFMSKGERIGVGVIRDITERVQSEADRTAMFHMVTHDIKGPLSIIYGYAELLNMQVDDPACRDMIADMQKAANRISALIDDMLALSRMESGAAAFSFGPATLKELVDRAVKDSEVRALEMGVVFDVRLDETPEFYADKNQLGRAIENLAINAVNYNRHGGRVTIRGGPVTLAGGAVGGVYVEVSDTGIGIPEEDLPKLFDKYFRSKTAASRRGTGLGLAIVKTAVEAHGGNVSVRSMVGEGTTFRIVLPLVPPGADSQQQGSQQA